MMTQTLDAQRKVRDDEDKEKTEGYQASDLEPEPEPRTRRGGGKDMRRMI
jgi:hypothetical protein